jgi:hypothetical protein
MESKMTKENKTNLEFIEAMSICGIEGAESLIQTKDIKLAERIRRRLRSKVFALEDAGVDWSIIERIYDYTSEVCEETWKARYKEGQKHWMYACE